MNHPQRGVDGSGWTDARGCLTASGQRALAQAPAGQAPPELAAHVAACTRCQRRALGLAETSASARRPPSPARTAFVLLALLLAGLMLLWTIRLLL